MAGEKQVVAEIRSFLDSGVLPPNRALRDMAERYAELCADVNRRLTQCELYLNRGMRTEAIHLAETSPPVLDLAAELHFHGVEAWREHCRENDLPAPALIASPTVSRLNQAYVKEDSLATLMTEYRRLVHQGTLAQQISLLRRIMRLDPDNAHWPEDVANLERARHSELTSEVKAAIEAKDVPHIELLQNELASSDWTVKPSPDLSADLAECLWQMRRKAAQKEGRKIARHMAHGYAALDYARTKHASGQWRALLATGDYVPPADLAKQVAEAEEWLRDQGNKLAQDKDFNNALRVLATALDRNLPLDDLERHVYAVSKHSRKIPDALRDRIERALADARLAAKRQFRIRMVAVCAIVLAVAIPLLLFARDLTIRRARTQWMSRIDAARSENDYDSAQALLRELEERRPRLYAEADFQDRTTRVAQEARQFAEMRAEFPRVMQQLEAIRDAGFPPHPPFSVLEDMARQYAYAPEEKIRFEAWLAALAAHKVQRTADANDAFAAVLSRITARFKQLDTLDPELDFDTFREVLLSAGKDFEEARSIQDVSNLLESQLDDLNKRSATLFANLDNAEKRIARKTELLKQLDRTAADLTSCERVLTSLLDEYSTHPEAAQWKRMQDECRWGTDLLRCNVWPVDSHSEMSAQAAMFLASSDARASLWLETMQWIADGQLLASPATNAKAEIMKLKDNWRFYDLNSFTSRSRNPAKDSGPKRYYYHEPLKRDVLLASAKGQEYKYTVEVFEKEHEEKTRTFSSLASILSLSENVEENLAAHCKFLRRVCPEIQQADPVTLMGTLLLRAEELRTMREVDPVVKVVFLHAFLTNAHKMSLAHRDVLTKAINVLVACNTNVYWMDPDPDDVTLAVKNDAAKVLAKLDDLAPVAYDIALQNRINRESLRRKPGFVGMLKARGEDVRMEFTDVPPQEVWIVTADQTGSTTVSILAEKGADGVCRILPGMKNHVLAGRPLFSPGDNRRTKDILARLTRDLPETSAGRPKSISWPRSWPVNARALGGS